MDDPRARVERLLPYFVRQARWGLTSEAREGIVASGGVAGPYLLMLFRDPGLRDRKEEIIAMLGQVKSRESVGDLVALLEEHDRFWATQDLEKGWWNRDVESALTRRRRDSYGEVLDAVIALGRIGDARAREAIDATRRRWRAIDFENPQMVEACESALKALAD
jgi:hypothetical protein